MRRNKSAKTSADFASVVVCDDLHVWACGGRSEEIESNEEKFQHIIKVKEPRNGRRTLWLPRKYAYLHGLISLHRAESRSSEGPSKGRFRNIMRSFMNESTYLMLSILLLHGKFLIIMQIDPVPPTFQHLTSECFHSKRKRINSNAGIMQYNRIGFKLTSPESAKKENFCLCQKLFFFSFLPPPSSKVIKSPSAYT